MEPRKRRILIWVVILTVGSATAWSLLLTQRSIKQVTSPDNRFTTIVRSSFPPFGDYRYDIRLKRSDGVVVRHLKMRDKLAGWGRDPSINWSADSKTVTVGLEDGDTDGAPPVALKRVSMDVD
jgi:hypothetical protein